MQFNFDIRPLNMTPKTPFRISRKTQTSVKNVLLRIVSGGITAYGESAPDKFYAETFSGVVDELKRFLSPRRTEHLPRHPEDIATLWRSASKKIKSRAALPGKPPDPRFLSPLLSRHLDGRMERLALADAGPHPHT